MHPLVRSENRKFSGQSYRHPCGLQQSKSLMIFAGQIGACQITAQIIFGSHIIRRKRIADLIQGSGNGNETADVVVDQKLAKLQLLFFSRRIGMYVWCRHNPVPREKM